MRLRRVAPDLKREMRNARFTKAYNEERLKLELAHQLAELREKNHLSQTALAKKMGVRPQIVSRIERGGLNLTVETIYRFAKSLNAEIRISFIAQGYRAAA